MATPSGGGGCIVSRAASNGGASGRAWTCARTRAGFPKSQTNATKARAVFSKVFQDIKISSGVIPNSSATADSAYLLHLYCRVSNRKSWCRARNYLYFGAFRLCVLCALRELRVKPFSSVQKTFNTEFTKN